jgi:hypothetical protein
MTTWAKNSDYPFWTRKSTVSYFKAQVFSALFLHSPTLMSILLPSICLFVCLFFVLAVCFLFWVWTQGFIRGRLVLYHLRHISSLLPPIGTEHVLTLFLFSMTSLNIINLNQMGARLSPWQAGEVDMVGAFSCTRQLLPCTPVWVKGIHAQSPGPGMNASAHSDEQVTVHIMFKITSLIIREIHVQISTLPFPSCETFVLITCKPQFP